jgi:hypothetical protein
VNERQRGQDEGSSSRKLRIYSRRDVGSAISFDSSDKTYDRTKKGFWASAITRTVETDTYQTQDDTILERKVTLVPKFLNITIDSRVILFQFLLPFISLSRLQEFLDDPFSPFMLFLILQSF